MSDKSDKQEAAVKSLMAQLEDEVREREFWEGSCDEILTLLGWDGEWSNTTPNPVDVAGNLVEKYYVSVILKLRKERDEARELAESWRDEYMEFDGTDQDESYFAWEGCPQRTMDGGCLNCGAPSEVPCKE